MRKARLSHAESNAASHSLTCPKVSNIEIIQEICVIRPRELERIKRSPFIDATEQKIKIFFGHFQTTS